MKNSLRAHILWTWLPTVLFITLIISLSFQPLPRLPRIRQVDKYLHIGVYGMLAMLSYRSFVRTGLRRTFIMAFLLTVAVGLADEGIQAMGTTRTADRYDLLADAGGAVLALLITRFFHRRSGDRSPARK